MVKIFVVYDSKYGNTKLAGESIAEGIRDTEGVEVLVSSVKEVDASKVAAYDVLVLGAPNHMARPSRTMMKFVDRLAGVELKAKDAAIFGTYSGRVRQHDRAVRKMEKTLEKKLPKINLLSPSLSIRVQGVTGPIVEGELSKSREFGKRIANQLKQKQ